MPKPPIAWTTEDEQRLTELKTEAITFKDTAMDVALKQSANAVKANISELDDKQALELLEALNQWQTTASNDTTTTTTHAAGESSGLL